MQQTLLLASLHGINFIYKRSWHSLIPRQPRAIQSPHLHGLSVCRSASPDQRPETAWVSNACNDQSRSNDSTEATRIWSLLLFSPPPPPKRCHLSSFFTPVFDGAAELSGRVMKKGTAQSLTYLAAKHRSTPHYSSGHLPGGVSHCSATAVRGWTNSCFGRLTVLRDLPIHYGKFIPSFSHADLGKGNRVDMVDMQEKHNTFVLKNGRFWNRHLGCLENL